MDWSGAFFSLMALGRQLLPNVYVYDQLIQLGQVAQNTFDVLGGVLYITWYAAPDLDKQRAAHITVPAAFSKSASFPPT
jgi:hypothetical protein